MSKFKPIISEVKVITKELHFVIEGDDKYGLDKSIMNGIRRTLLNDIPTVAFKTDENLQKKDITVVTNIGQLHNEMLLQRISLIPLYIDPSTYMKNYLFELKVKHDNSEIYKFITINDFNIYPLKLEIQSRLNSSEDDEIDEELDTLLNSNNYENYDLNNPLSNKQKDLILKPFTFRGKTTYCLLTELKTTNEEDLFQEIHLYGVPSLGTGKDNARFQAVSNGTYSFKKDEDLIKSIIQERIKLEKIEEEDQESFIEKLILSESEKYYFRDLENEPYKYNFIIKSVHYLDSATLFLKSIELLIDKLDYLKLSFLRLLQDKDTCISPEKINEFVYHFMIYNEDHTMGNIIQSHIARRSIDKESILQMCAYKKPHPLEESIKLIISLNPENKIVKENDLRKFQSIVNYLIEELENIKKDLKILYEVSEKAF